ncbi:MAG: chemotaxis protein CheA [Nannocystaceae bacterium]|nr:chemotaxis protein CheA [Nannocystaceae bacterium]
MATATKRTIDEAGWALFADDATAATADIEEGLLVLEQNPQNGEQINALFRALHTLKGSSGFVGLAALGRLAHEAENLVGRVRDGELTLSTVMVDVLLGVLDMLRSIVDESSDGPVPEHEAAILPLCEKLRVLSGADKHEKATPERLLKLSEELGVMLQTCREACDQGALERSPELESLARDARSTAEQLGFPACTEYFGGLLEALLAGRTRSLRLHWYLAHSKVEDAVAGELVFFDAGDSDGPAEDDEAIRVFLTCVILLLSPLVHELRLASKEPREGDLVPVLGELTSIYELVESPTLMSLLTALKEDCQQTESHLADREAAAKIFVGAVAAFEQEWTDRTGLAVSEQDSIATMAASLWTSDTQPYRKVKEGSSGSADGAQKPVVDAVTPVRQKAANQPRGAKFLRIEASKVEQLMALAGELGLAVGAVFNHSDVEALDHEDLRSDIGRVEGLIRELQDASAGFALVPVSTVFNRMNRLARDLIRQTGKKFELVIQGGDTEIDKLWVDALLDPLIHLIRNAADHGIESAEKRLAAGKPEIARIVLSAQHQGGNVEIKLEDDGGGMNRQAILGRAVDRGIVSEEAAETICDTDVWDLVFAPGFSTTQTVSNISGRGMGMDVVRAAVQAHRGHVSIASFEGRGTCVTLQVPLTLAFLDGMVVRVGSWLYVLPVTAVTRVFRVGESELVRVKSGSVDLVRVGEELVPCLELEEFFSEGESQDILGRLVVVVHAARGKMAIPIDELVGQEQVTMNPLSGFLTRIRGAAACGLLRSGEVAIALDCERLHAQAL